MLTLGLVASNHDYAALPDIPAKMYATLQIADERGTLERALPDHPGRNVLLRDLVGDSRRISCFPACGSSLGDWPLLLPGSRELASAPDVPAFPAAQDLGAA
jgi:hypothetical protein